jgi:hypothetical protein
VEISSSKRALARGSSRPFHLRLALRRAWQQRWFYGSILAFGGALAGWLSGLGLMPQLALAALGLALGLGWRYPQTRRDSERWAFSWIEERTGLSYQTAVELEGDDAHGFAEAVRARAVRANSLPLPTLQPWSLPLLLLTALLLALPHLALPALRTPLAGITPAREGAPSPLETPAESETAPQNVPEAPAPAQNDPLLESQDSRPGETSASEADSRSSFESETSAERGAAAAAGEQDALEAFLAQQQSQTAPQGEEGAGGSSPAGSSEEQAANSREGAGNDERQGGDGEGQQAGEQETPSEGQQPSESQTPSERPQQQAEDNNVQQSSGNAAQPQETPPDEQMRNTERTAQESERNNEQNTTDGVDMLQMRNSASQEKENLNQLVREGEASERAGTGPGAEIESSRERLGGNTSQAERLRGERGDGPSSMVRGQVREQGRAPDGLPQSGDAASYRQAAEEVIREGRIPAEYQTIVRDYFR